MASLGSRHCIRQHLRPFNAFIRPLHLRYVSSSPLNSTYYVQTFVHSKEQYILLLPETSPPMGRIKLSTLPSHTSIPSTGPTTDMIVPISPDKIKADWMMFVENGGFREILQNVIKENIAQEEMVINDARSLQGGNGWIHLCDERALPAYISRFVVVLTGRFGRIPETEDIVGSVYVKDNQIQPETYQKMPTYRFVTRQGPMKLSDFLLEKLRARLKELA